MISLDMIEEIESVYGGIYQLTENIINNSLPNKIIEDILSFIDYEVTGDDNPKDVLSNILLDILEPIERMGAIELGELLAA